MADEPRGFNPDWKDPREPGTDPIPVGSLEPTPTHGVPLESLPPPIKGGIGVSVSYDGYAYVIDVDTSDLTATPKPGTVTWETLAPDVEAMIRDFSWGSLTGVPTTFPPSAHTHPWDQVTDKPGSYPPSAHQHPWTDIINTPATYPPSAHTHPWTEVTGKPTSYPPSAHVHPIEEVLGLEDELAEKIEDAPSDGVTYGRKNGAWTPAAGAAQIQDSAPASGDPGTFWWSSSTGVLAIRYNDGNTTQWVALNGSLSAALVISDAEPTNAYHGMMWLSSTDMALYARYDDGNTEQWVQLLGGGTTTGRIVEMGTNYIVYQSPSDPNLRIMEQWGHSNAVDGATVTFPKAFHNGYLPVVSVTAIGAIPITSSLEYNAGTVTNTGFTIVKRYINWTSGGGAFAAAGQAAQDFMWRAIGVAT